MAAKLKDFHLKNVERSEYQLICDRGGGFIEAISLLTEKKNCLTVSISVSTCICYDLVISEIQWRVANQGVFCFSTISSGKRLLALSPPPTPVVHSDSKLNMAGGINDRKPITLARTK